MKYLRYSQFLPKFVLRLQYKILVFAVLLKTVYILQCLGFNTQLSQITGDSNVLIFLNYSSVLKRRLKFLIRFVNFKLIFLKALTC